VLLISNYFKESLNLATEAEGIGFKEIALKSISVYF